jgi:multidrug efflux pump subunit AcrA (membrane-fusion protein)
MAFMAQDYHDLTRLLMEHPEWRAELRRLLLSDELLSLPEIVRALAAAQQRTEQRLEELAAAQQRTEQRLEELAAAQQRTEQRLEELAAAQQRTEQRLEELAAAQQRTEQKIGVLIEEMKYAKDDLGKLLGWRLEARYREKPSVFFGRWLKPVIAMPFESVREFLEAHLTEEELEEVMRLDLLVRGNARKIADKPEVWLALEVSGAIDAEDVERVKRRTALLRKAGLRAVPVVAGEGVIPEATTRLEGAPIVLMLNGRSQGWELAFAEALSA